VATLGPRIRKNYPAQLRKLADLARRADVAARR
jgi:hypothetical protein